jgi:hypothetical protein
MQLIGVKISLGLYLTLLFLIIENAAIHGQVDASVADFSSIKLKRSVFQLRNARTMVGIGASLNWANAEGNTGMNAFTGSMPDDYDIKFDTAQGAPFFSAGVYFDLYSPNSFISLTGGLEYNSSTFQIFKNDGEISSIKVERVQVPIYLNWYFAKVSAKSYPFLSIGAVYGAVVNNNISVNSSSKEGIEFNNNLAYSARLGYTAEIGNSSEATSEFEGNRFNNEKFRLQFFVRADMMANDLFGKDAISEIDSDLNSDNFEYRDLNWGVGLNVFYRLNSSSY